MREAVYRLPDEPRPGALARFAVQPLLPLFAMMLVGGWLAWPWFVFNGRVLGSPTRTRELVLVAGAVLGCVAVMTLGAAAVGLGWIEQAQFKYWLLWLPAIKLGAAYYLYLWQERVVGLYQHFGGQLARAGVFVLAAGFMLDRGVSAALAKTGMLVWGALS